MARSLTSRLGLQRWSADSDTQQRSDFDNDNAQLESLVAKAAHGAIGARPASSAAMADSFYLITDATGGGVIGTLYYCDGTTWTVFAPRKQGLAVNRPAASLATQTYYKTDSDLLSIDDGTAWHDFPSKAVTDGAYAPLSNNTAWTTYTPTLGSVTLGNGTITGRYKQMGKTVTYRATLTLGSTTTFTGGGSQVFIGSPTTHGPISAYAPVNAFHSVQGQALGFAFLNAGGTSGGIYLPFSLTDTRQGQFAGGTTWLAAAPGAGSTIDITGTYESA
jgi:hypothetical protein